MKSAVQEIRRLAFESVLRACSFGLLAIFCVMVGFSYNPKLSFQIGGFLMTGMSLILVLKARLAPARDYRRTEIWLYLPQELRPPQAAAQGITGSVLRDTFLIFAMWTAGISVILGILALFFSFLEG
jgi:hypothetical protein